jgi:hypothetical protein
MSDPARGTDKKSTALRVTGMRTSCAQGGSDHEISGTHDEHIPHAILIGQKRFVLSTRHDDDGELEVGGLEVVPSCRTKNNNVCM